MIIKHLNEDISIEYALNLLLSGKVVAVPTETVYGLAANISDQNAVNKIYSIKNRPLDHPLIVHIANKKDLQIYCNNIPGYVMEIIDKLWPGPITFILNKTQRVPNYVTGGQDTVAIRMPSHKLTLKLIDKFGQAIVAPSANKFTGISPTRPEHVIDEFGEIIDVLDGGPCEHGLESTIIDATNANFYKILRYGSITSEKIDFILKEKYSQIRCSNNLNHKLKFPGNHLKHYSPKKNLLLFKNKSDFEILIKKFTSLYVIYYSLELSCNKLKFYKIENNPHEFARNFYHALRMGDNSDCQAIAIEAPPIDSENWTAIWDRLNKAIIK